MATSNPHPSLPPDIILCIIDFVMPAPPLLPIALPAAHSATRTLLSLTRTSRTTYPAALRLLLTHCLYIDSPWRLSTLIESLSALAAHSAGTSDAATARLPTLPDVQVLHHVTSLYVAPFTHRFPALVTVISTLRSLSGLLRTVGPALRRLIIDIPWARLFPRFYFYPGEMQILGQDIARLSELELLCSVRDDIYLNNLSVWDDIEPPPLWPKLKTLALFNATVCDTRLWPILGKLGNLETLVLTRPSGLPLVDVKAEWRKHCGYESELNIVVVNVESEHEVPERKDRWTEADKVVVRELNVPTSYYGDESSIILCQEWVKRRVLRAEEVAAWT